MCTETRTIGALALSDTTIEAWRSLTSAPSGRTAVPILNEDSSLAQTHDTRPKAAGSGFAERAAVAKLRGVFVEPIVADVAGVARGRAFEPIKPGFGALRCSDGVRRRQRLEAPAEDRLGQGPIEIFEHARDRGD